MSLNLNKKSGFSMLELIVVMLIMGALAGIAISKMSGSDTGAIKTSIKSDLRNTIRGMNSCYMDELDFNQCLPTANQSGRTSTIYYRTTPRERTLGNSIYVGITTNGNSIKITTSATNSKFFAVSRLNLSINGYFDYNNSTDSSISLFTTGGTHPVATP